MKNMVTTLLAIAGFILLILALVLITSKLNKTSKDAQVLQKELTTIKDLNQIQQNQIRIDEVTIEEKDSIIQRLTEDNQIKTNSIKELKAYSEKTENLYQDKKEEVEILAKQLDETISDFEEQQQSAITDYNTLNGNYQDRLRDIEDFQAEAIKKDNTINELVEVNKSYLDTINEQKSTIKSLKLSVSGLKRYNEKYKQQLKNN